MTARVRSRAPNFARTELTWDFTVSVPTMRVAAISAFDIPRAIDRSTAASRSVSAARSRASRALSVPYSEASCRTASCRTA